MIINSVDFNAAEFIGSLSVQKRNRHKRTKLKYLDIVTAFDIEASNLDDIHQAVMYIWQWQCGPEYTVIGRTWSEFRALVADVKAAIPEGCRLVVYVHNLSYEFQFLKSVIEMSDVMALDNRKVLRCMSGPLEFRCSYLHSNQSLKKFLESMNVEDRKLDYDYNKIRFSDTELSDAELQYCINDVKGLEEALRTEMERDGDDLYTIPLTSTGYIRRLAKDSLGGYQRYMKRWLPSLEVMQLLRREFRGGNTHANRWNADRIINASPRFPINSYDISSDYPYQLISQLYPCEFFKRDPSKFRVSMKYGKACLMLVHLRNVRLKDKYWGCPYIAKAKCDTVINGVYDNGRVLSADDIVAVYNEIDFVILESEYDFEFEVLELYVARKQKLPKTFRDLVLSEYVAKTALKGVDEYRYAKTKNRFNSLYGMTVQNPIKPNIKYNDTGEVIKLPDDTEVPPGALYEDFETPLETLIKDYHDKGWIPYQVGVWVSSYARLLLERGLAAIPPDAFLYCDTDSIKFVGDHDKAFAEINDSIRNDDFSALDRKGVRHYMGVFEKETSDEDPILRFKTMGAKKYAYEDSHGLHLTLAGVGKKTGAAELGTLDNFKSGFVFRKAAGTESVYNDQMEPRILKYMDRRLEITSNLYIRDSKYTLDLDFEYRKMLAFLCTTDIRSSMHYER